MARSIRFRQGALSAELAARGISWRQFARDTTLAIGTLVSANQGNSINGLTAAWIIDCLATRNAEVTELRERMVLREPAPTPTAEGAAS